MKLKPYWCCPPCWVNKNTLRNAFDRTYYGVRGAVLSIRMIRMSAINSDDEGDGVNDDDGIAGLDTMMLVIAGVNQSCLIERMDTAKLVITGIDP